MPDTLPNAYLVQWTGDAVEPIVVQEQPEGEAGRLHRLENDRYTVLLRGHMYCDSARTFEAGESLQILLDALTQRRSLPSALKCVSGGIFALFVVDRQRHRIQVAGDRLGCMPIYYREAPASIDFSNNPFTWKGSNLDPVAVGEYLKFGHLPFSDSLFEGVRRVQPGQVITVSLAPTLNLVLETAPYRSYRPVEERIQSPEEGAERLAAALDRYFARLGGGRGAAGLSGGYDSRLIAAYTSGHAMSYFNFGNPASKEVKLAQRVARRLGHPLDAFRIPVEAVRRHGDRFQTGMPNLDSFEDAHVFELVDRVRSHRADYYVDGFIGDTVIGGGYFYKLGSGRRQLFDNLRMRERFESPLLGAETYVDRLLGNKRAVPDASLQGLVDEVAVARWRGRARQLVDAHRLWCPTHEDMIESLTHATRGRCLIAGGPVAVGAHATCLTPFIDREVFDTAMDCAKHVRAGDRLYNALWRRRFPNLADLPKSNTGARPKDSDRTYRLKHLANAVLRRSVYPKLHTLTGGRWDAREEYSSAHDYVACPDNARYLNDLARKYESALPANVASSLIPGFRSGTLTPAVTLRLGSLMAYLA